MSRWLGLIVVLAGCRTLLGIEDGVVGDPKVDAPTNTDADAVPSVDACAVQDCACRTNSDCASGVCIGGATCADANNVAYVAENGSGNACLQALPCSTVNAGFATGKPFVKIRGKVKNTSTASATSARSIYGDDPTTDVITNESTGPVLQVLDNTTIELDRVGIEGASGVGAHGIVLGGVTSRLVVTECHITNNAGSGIATQLGTLIVDRSIIANNDGVGLAIDFSQFTITNTIIARNGSPTSSSGGADLDPAGISTFELNTVWDNDSMLDAGMSVSISCVAPVEIKNSIASGRLIGCQPRSSLLETQQGPGSNFTGSPAFLSTLNPNLPTFMRIGPSSMARDRGTASSVTIDIDNEPRPTGTAIDVGADEFVP